MNINSNLICSFNQKLSYNDFLNFNRNINSFKEKIKLIFKHIIRYIYTIFKLNKKV